jgi:hypothetical protein
VEADSDGVVWVGLLSQWIAQQRAAFIAGIVTNFAYTAAIATIFASIFSLFFVSQISPYFI